MSEAVVEITQELIEALKVVMDVGATRENRASANKFLEEFQDASHFCADCGFYIFSHETQPGLQHFGLLLVEHAIKFQWNAMALEQKFFVKNSLMQILKDGTKGILAEYYYIKNAIAKNVVEIIKREWPQQWPGMMQELYSLGTCGETQTELVLLILLRIAEDVVVLQNVDVQRRREIYQSLTANLSDIFEFFTSLLQTHVTEYLKLKQGSSGDGGHYEMNVHCQVAVAVFNTLVQYLDWVPISHVMTNKAILLRMFCDLLEDDMLKYPSIECLLTTTGRKGKPDDRKPLLHLFDEEYMTILFKVARMTNEGPIQEKEYVFLKRLCQVFINLGTILCSLWGVVSGINFPPNFSSYVKAMINLTGHASQVLSSYAIAFWSSLFRHEHICKEAAMLSLLPDIVDAISQKLLKVGFPSRSDSPSCAFSRLDFDSDEDFNTFFLKFRNECADVLRLATTLAPQITFECAARWLQIQLQKPIDCGDTGENNSGMCSMLSPSYLEWDALSTCLECALVKIHQTDTYKDAAEKGVPLLEAVLLYQAQDPLILSAKLSCISALFVFLKYAPQTLTVVFEHIFTTVVFSLPGQTKSNRSRAVKNVRRHACSCLVKICKFYPELLLPSFDTLLEFVNKLSVDPEQLSQMEKCTLTEALILISNRFQNFQKQAEFIKGILAPVSAVWLSEDMQIAFSSIDGFLAYVGLDQPPVEPSIDDVHGINRSQITYCINMIFAVIKRSVCPKDVDASKPGVSAGVTRSNSPVINHPAMAFVAPLLPPLFRLLRIFNMLWLPEAQSKISPLYAKANDILDIDKNNVLGVSPPCVDGSEIPQPKQPLERMQIFLTSVHDNCYHILRNACPNLGYGFYSLPHLIEYLHHSSLINFFGIPDYRVRPIIRVFMKLFVLCCPQDLLRKTVVPVLSTLCPLMYQRLSQKWTTLNQHAEEINGEEDNIEVQEVLEEQLHRQLTREYLDLLGAVLQSKKSQAVPSNEMMDDDDNNLTTPSTSEGIGELGQIVFHNNELYPSVVLCILNALYWNDTHASLKASQICLPIIKQLVLDGNLGAEEAQHILLSVLMGLQQHGQHESNASLLLTLGLQAYEIMRPLHANLTNVLQQIPNCSQSDIAIFDEKLLNIGPNKVLPEKKKKDLFRGLVSPLIGKSVSKMFQRKVLIKKLPPLFCLPKPKAPPVEENFGICELFSQKP